MKRVSVACIAASAVAVCCGIAGARPPGADVIAGDVTGVSSYGPLTVNGVAYTAYAFGTTSCNVGTPGSAPEPWVAGTNQHPLISQNLYRLKNNRFEQIGMSWLKHSFGTVNNGICGSCTGPTGSQLYVGCSDPYGSGLNGDQFYLGPRSEVNAFTGEYPFPYLTAWRQTGDALFKRMRVKNDDVNPTLNSGAIYFGEGQYVSNNEATLGNGFNNASYRRILVSGSSAPFTLAFTSSTQREKPAIQAWKDTDPTVTLQQVFIPGEGLIYVGAKAFDLGNGQWQYEYAVYNHNSHASVGSFFVSVANSVSLSNIGFHDIDYSNDEPYTNIDWPGVRNGGGVIWETTPYDAAFVPPVGVPAKQGGYANALRWGSTYNFWFTANQPPMNGLVQFTTWRPSVLAPLSVTVPVPSVPPPVGCPGDANGDNTVDSADLSVLLSNFGASVSGGASSGDFNNDGHCDVADLSVMLSNFGSSC